MDESTNGHSANKLAVLVPGLAKNADSLEERVDLNGPDGEPSGVTVVFALLDAQTKNKWDRLARLSVQKKGRARDAVIQEMNFLVWDRKCKRVEGITPEMVAELAPDADGMDAKEFIRRNELAHSILNLAVNTYWDRQTPSADDSSKSL